MNNNELITIHLSQKYIDKKLEKDPDFIYKRNKHIIENNNNDPIGCILYSKNYGLFKIIRDTGEKRNREIIYKIKFINTEYNYDVEHCAMIRGNVKDLLYKSIYEIACLGKKYKEIRKTYPALCKTLLKRYFAIISRCYNLNDSHYYTYGALGYTVSEEWLDFSNFFYDILDIINSTENPKETIDRILSSELEIDKDKKQINCDKRIYSKDTISLIDKKENIKIRNSDIKNVYHFAYSCKTDSNPVWKTYNNVRKFARENNTAMAHILDCINGKAISTNNYIFRKLTNDEYLFLESIGFPDEYVLGDVQLSILNKHSKKISIFAYAYLKDVNPIWLSYNNVSEFARINNLSHGNISACLNGKLTHVGKFIFRRLTDDEYSLLESLGFPDNYELCYVNKEME